MRGKAKVKTTQFLKTSLILVLTLSLATFTFLAFFMSHQSASTIREVSQLYMSSMGDQLPETHRLPRLIVQQDLDLPAVPVQLSALSRSASLCLHPSAAQ